MLNKGLWWQGVCDSIRLWGHNVQLYEYELAEMVEVGRINNIVQNLVVTVSAAFQKFQLGSLEDQTKEQLGT